MGNFLGSAAGIIFLLAVLRVGADMVSELGIFKSKHVVKEFLYIFVSSTFIGLIFLGVSCWTSNLLHGRANITDFERIFASGQKIAVPVYSDIISFLGGIFFGKTVLVSFMITFAYMGVFAYVVYLMIKKTRNGVVAKKSLLLLFSIPGYFMLYLPVDILLSYSGKTLLLCIPVFIALIFFFANIIVPNIFIYKICLFVNMALNSYVMYCLMDVHQLSSELRYIVCAYMLILVFLAFLSTKFDFKKHIESNHIRCGVIFAACVIGNWIVLYQSCKYIILRQAPPQTMFNLFRESFIKAGDSPHYLNIAQNGYQLTGDDAKLIVFFPLYPLLLRVVQLILNDYFVSGVLLSNFLFGIACCYLYRVIREDCPDDNALDALLLLMLFPYGLFFVGVFTESLFFMLTVMCIFYARKKKWIVSGVLGFLCALARIQGVLIFAFLAYEYLIGISEEGASRLDFFQRLKRVKLDALALAGAPVGLFIYLLLNKALHGNWLAFLEFQAAPPWFQSSKWIGDNITQHYNMSKEYYGLTFIIYTVQIILFFAALAAFIYAMRKKMRTSYIFYGLVYTGVTFLSGWMISGARYMMSCLPLYLIFAGVKSEYARFLILFTNGLLVVVYFIYFLKGNSIM